MAKDIDLWGVGPKVAGLWATGARGRAIAKLIIDDVAQACHRLKMEPPNVENLTMTITRYMATDPGRRRTRQAKNQEQAKQLEVQAVGQILTAQVDAAQTLQRYVERIDLEVQRINEMLTIDPRTGSPVAPDFGEYYRAFSSMSKEMRGWITLLVDIKDRMWQQEQFQRALDAILSAMQSECPPEVLLAIMRRLQADPAVMAMLGGPR